MMSTQQAADEPESSLRTRVRRTSEVVCHVHTFAEATPILAPALDDMRELSQGVDVVNSTPATRNNKNATAGICILSLGNNDGAAMLARRLTRRGRKEHNRTSQ